MFPCEIWMGCSQWPRNMSFPFSLEAMLKLSGIDRGHHSSPNTKWNIIVGAILKMYELHKMFHFPHCEFGRTIGSSEIRKTALLRPQPLVPTRMTLIEKKALAIEHIYQSWDRKRIHHLIFHAKHGTLHAVKTKGRGSQRFQSCFSMKKPWHIYDSNHISNFHIMRLKKTLH